MSKPPVHLLDGGLGTILTDRYGYIFDDSTPLWSSHLLLTKSGQKTLKDAHSAFAAAGADVLLTATYQASFQGFASSGVSDLADAETYMRKGIGIAREAFQGRAGKVALSLGAYGATTIPGSEYSGAYDEEHCGVEKLRNWHSERLNVFLKDEQCWGIVDYVAFETLPRLDEVLAVRKVMSSLPATLQKPFWISCVFPGAINKLPDGSHVSEVVGAMLGGEESKPVAIGLNCTRVGKVEGLVGEFEDAVRLMEKLGETGLVVYPDGTRGEVYNTTTKVWETGEASGQSKTPWDEEVFQIVEKARLSGIWKEVFVGGCCKTTQEHIAALKGRIAEL